ncbi:MAG: S8 family serine peptidase [Bacteroidota bacterium]
MNRFSSFKKLVLSTGVIAVTALEMATAAVAPAPRPVQKSLYQLGSPETGYTIVRPGEKRADGFTTAARILSMPRLTPDNYMPGVINVKTKQRFVVNKDARGFQSAALSQSLSALGVKKIDAAFKEYNNGSLLAADKAGLSRMYEVYYSSPVDAYDVCRELMNNPDVEYASPVFKRALFYTPNDTKVAQQYELTKIKAAQAWDVTKGKTEVLIAITDSGIDWQHEDLADNIYINTKEIPANGKDDDNNGKVDDIHGWDFVGNASSNDVMQGIFKEDNDPKIYGITSTTDTRAHGTVVAGNAAAVTNNGKGVASIGHNCKLLPIKIGSDDPQAGGLYQTAKAIEYAARMKADIINCSWGGRGLNPMDEDVIAQATAGGSLVVVAAGNDGLFTDVSKFYPAGYPNVLSVGATDNADKKAGFSNYGINTSVYAPGVGLPSVYPNNRYVTDANTWSGTSFSSPVVAGIAGLVKSVHPDWTPAQIAAQIRMTSDNVVTTDASLRPLYFGRANAFRAVSLNGTINQGNQAPGLEIVSVGLSAGGGVVTDAEPTTLRLSLRNLLSDASGVQLQIQPMDGVFSIAQGTVSVGAVASMEQKDIDATIQLSANTPFFSGMGEFLVTITSGTFTNYHRISIPFQIPSTNTYAFATSYGEFTYHSASSPNPSTAWAASEYNGGAVVFRVANGVTTNSIASQTSAIYSIYARDANVAYGGTGPTSGAAQILRTTNGGITGWQVTSVSTITPFVNNINFFDATNGIFLGDPLNSSWGIGKTTNSGQAWTKVNNVPAPLSGETGLNTSATWLGDNGWFGTTKGRVYRTSDKGQTWKASNLLTNGVVSLLAFKDALNGIAIYRTTQATDAPTLAAVTSDGGATWSLNKFNFDNARLAPVYAYNPGDSRQTAVLCSDGSVIGTEDLGNTWKFILTRQSGTTSAGAGVANGQSVRLWNFGAMIGYLNYTKLNGSVKREITLAQSLAFDSVLVGANKTKLMKITNSGDVDITISGIDISGGNSLAGEFAAPGKPTLPKTLAPGASVSFQVIFNAGDIGIRTATMVVTSNAEPAISNVELTGIGKKVGTSVKELEAAGFRLEQNFPNPTNGQTAFRFVMPSAQNVRLAIANTLGQTLAIPFDGMAQAGYTSVPFNAEALSNGVYYYTLQIGGQKIVRSFVVSK